MGYPSPYFFVCAFLGALLAPGEVTVGARSCVGVISTRTPEPG